MGVRIVSESVGNTVGGSGTRRNIIAFNAKGVVVGSSLSDNSFRNVISRNSIFQNDDLGIDLGNDGVTPNQPIGSGPNNRMNFPVLTGAQIIGPNLVIEGRVLPGSVIEFFIADPDPTGFGEGQTFLFARVEGVVARDANDAGNQFRFVIPLASLPAPVAAGTVLTSTATINNAQGDNGTSEFSANIAVTQLQSTPVANLTVTKVASARQVAVGQLVTFTITAHNLGPDLADGVVVTDRLPAGVAFVSARPSQGTYNAATGQWNVIALGANDSATLRLTVRVTATGTIRNAARIMFHGDDPDPSNNAAAAAINGVVISKRMLLRSSFRMGT
jgi:uncharacterized repeat protein (TIGR01451 family)